MNRTYDRLLSNAQLGRIAASAVRHALGKKDYPLSPNYINKTEKYISCKFLIDHLTPDQMQKAEEYLRVEVPNRFLKITNSIANCGDVRCGIVTEWQEPKVLFRFTQAA